MKPQQLRSHGTQSKATHTPFVTATPPTARQSCRVNSAFWRVAALLLAMLVLSAVQPAFAAEEETPPGLQEYKQMGQQAVKATLPTSVAGMERVSMGAGPRAAGGMYAGGEPLPKVRLMVWSGDRMLKRMRKMAAQGNMRTITRNGRTVYLRVTGPEGDVLEEPGAAVVVDGTVVSLEGQPGGANKLSSVSVRDQLLAVLGGLDLERVAGAQAPSLLASGQFEVSGAYEATLPVTKASPYLWGGFTENRWSIALINEAKAMAVRLFWLPLEIEPGQYTLHAQPNYMGEGWMELLSVKFRVDESGPSEHSGVWMDNVTGTLTVESVQNGRMTGHFQFKAYRDGAPPVEVTGRFEKLVILDGE